MGDTQNMRGSLVSSLLLFSCFAAVLADRHHGGHYPPVGAPAPSHHHNHNHNHNHPAHPPVHPPVHPPLPAHPPFQGPGLPPIPAPGHLPLPPRLLVAVQGVVYCKSCKHRGVDTLVGASPLLGATVKLECNNTKHPLVVLGKTDKNGYFFIQAPKKITTYGVHKCKVFLVSSSSPACDTPTDLHSGTTGAVLRFDMKKPPLPPAGAPAHPPPPPPFAVFSVGPLAFEPAKKVECPR